MFSLPKIALARLKAAAESARSSRGPSVTAGFQGAEHPDANLLAALAEKTLTEQERTQVLDHLSECTACREIATLMLPADVMVEPSAVGERRRWNPWIGVRWAAIATVLGTLTVVIVLHPTGWKRSQEISKSIPPAAPGRIDALAPKAGPSPRSPQPSPPAQAEKQKSSPGGAAKMGPPARDSALQKRMGRRETRQSFQYMPSTLGAQSHSESLGSVRAERAYEGINSPHVKAQRASGAEPKAASDEADKATTQSPTPPVVVRTVQSGAVSPPPPAASPDLKDAASVAPAENSQATAHSGLGGMIASRKSMALEVAQPMALWTVSADGKVQRSLDGGKSFKNIRVSHGIKFRAIASLGSDVWAAGVGGTLFHSSDGGFTWTGTTIGWEGGTVTETIVGLQLRDARHLMVTGDSGSQWISEDAGQHWMKQR